MAIEAEDKIDTRKLIYGVTALIGIIATIGQAVNLIDSHTADSIQNLIQALAQFLPTAGVTTAAVVLGRQAKQPGVLSPTGSPLDQVINGAQQILADQAAANDVAEQLKQGLQNTVGSLVPAEIQADIAAAGRALGLPPLT